ncbi:MAG: thioredoxin domain-containing protein [Anaerolineaceae bacterium]|nr:thioredoxin domain-containing protein [Anaerolineaceae bacterium]
MTSVKSLRSDVREKEKTKKRRALFIVGGLLLSVALIILAINLLFLKANKPVFYANVNGFTVGKEDAPVKVEEYSNFNCSHCKFFADTLEENFVKKYVDTGKVQFTFRIFPFTNDRTEGAVEASYCAADQNKFWPMKSLLFKYNGYSGAFEDGNLINYAKTAGLDLQAFSDCIKSDKYLPKVAEDRQAAIDKGLDGTPYFFANGQKVGLDDLEKTVDAQLQSLGK